MLRIHEPVPGIPETMTIENRPDISVEWLSADPDDALERFPSEASLKAATGTSRQFDSLELGRDSDALGFDSSSTSPTHVCDRPSRGSPPRHPSRVSRAVLPRPNRVRRQTSSSGLRRYLRTATTTVPAQNQYRSRLPTAFPPSKEQHARQLRRCRRFRRHRRRPTDYWLVR
jgi:hypothetical protein